jgi:uncharacterized protein
MNFPPIVRTADAARPLHRNRRDPSVNVATCGAGFAESAAARHIDVSCGTQRYPFLMSFVILFAAVLAAASAQESRREITPSTSPNDSQPNSDKVPAVSRVSTQFERVVVLRFKYDTELLSALEKAIAAEKIQNAVFLSGFGSVRNYHIHQVSNRTLPSKNVFVKDPTMPADITGFSGMVLNGRLHPHITLASPEKAFAGHLEPGTNVFTFAVITLGVLPANLDVSRYDDKNWR